MAFVRGFLRFWYDFIVGDDWRIALGVVLVLAAGARARGDRTRCATRCSSRSSPPGSSPS